MNKRIAAIALCAAGVALFWLFRPARSLSPSGEELPPAGKAVSVSQPARVVNVETPAISGVTPMADSNPAREDRVSAPSGGLPGPTATREFSNVPEFSDLPPETVLENMRGAIRLYGSMFGGNPVGTNPEITRALNGGNAKHVTFLKPESGLRINEKGELIDPWGTPFFFHQLSGREMEIHSAGPDRVMWTPDDLITR